MAFERLLYTLAGAVAYKRDNVPQVEKKPILPSSSGDKPHIVFTFWDAPEAAEGRYLMNELHDRFDGGGLPIGVGLFVRPMGDVIPEQDCVFDQTKLNCFLDAAKITRTKVFIITSGMHWTEVAYQKSPLLRKLEEDPDNLMQYRGNMRVERKLQPPGNRLLSALGGPFGTDANGVLYLSHHSPQVQEYRERNLAQMAEIVKSFADHRPDLYLGISTENEVDYPGKWITKGREVDFNPHTRELYKKYRERGIVLSLNEFKTLAVRNILRENVRIFQDAGLTNIYTNQSLEDAENRVSPLSSIDIEGSNIGVTAWRTGNYRVYDAVHKLAQEGRKRWALVITNPLSLDVAANVSEIRDALDSEPALIGIYNWWPHFWGYGVRGMSLEKALKSLTS